MVNADHTHAECLRHADAFSYGSVSCSESKCILPVKLSYSGCDLLEYKNRLWVNEAGPNAFQIRRDTVDAVQFMTS